MLMQFHKDMNARVVMSDRLLDDIPKDNGVKQGDVLSTTLFLIFFSIMLIDAFQHCEGGVLLEFKTKEMVFD